MGEARHPESKHAYAKSNPETAPDQAGDFTYWKAMFLPPPDDQEGHALRKSKKYSCSR